jgi:hypothetical protein
MSFSSCRFVRSHGGAKAKSSAPHPVPLVGKRLDYFCPKCDYKQAFRNLDQFRANRFCPKDGTMLRPVGWEPKRPARNSQSPAETALETASPSKVSKKASVRTNLKNVMPGQTGLVVEATVVNKRSSIRHSWREHAVATITDGSATLPLNLWREQVSQVSVGDTIRLREAFAQTRGGGVILSTWEDPIEIVGRRNRRP